MFAQGLDTVWEMTITGSELVLKQFLPYKLFCFLWFLGANQTWWKAPVLLEGLCLPQQIYF